MKEREESRKTLRFLVRVVVNNETKMPEDSRRNKLKIR